MKTQIDFSKYIRTKDEDKTHALYSPSGMERTIHCPGSVRLIAKAPKEPDNKYSIMGTNAHTLLEFLLREGIDGIMALKTKDADPFKEHIAFTEPMYHSVLKAFHFVRNKRGELQDKVGIKPKMLVERKVHLEEIVNADCSGTADIIMFHHFGELHVMDYKNGTSIVNAENNAQMMTYALGFLEEFGWDFKKIVLHIIQPNAVTEKFVRTWEASIEDMEAFKKRLIRAVKLSKQKDAPLNPDPKHCYFCAARNICPVKNEERRGKLMEKFKR